MGYREKYYTLIDELRKEILDFYGDRLISLVIFGSDASDTFKPGNDIDVLIVAKDFPRVRLKRAEEFVKNVERKIERYFNKPIDEHININISPIFKTPEEVYLGSPIFLDVTENCRILFDKNDFFARYIEELRGKLKNSGLKKVIKKVVITGY